MKKIVSRILAVVVFAVTMFLVGCSNVNIGLGSFSYHWVHIPQNDVCFKVNSWREVETGIEIQTEEYGGMFFAEGTYILVSNESEGPICAKLKEA